MSRSEEIREQAMVIVKEVEEKNGKVPMATINLSLAMASFAMLTEITCQLADMNERKSK